MSESSSRPGAGSERLRSLDGLRGAAAVVVLMFHLSLVFPQIASLTTPPPPGSIRWLAEDTPLKLATAGSEAVLVFFVLSGMVVAMPVLRRAEFDWLAYYPRRLVRLGLPVLASVAFASVLILSHPQLSGPQVSNWVGSNSVAHPTATDIVGSADLFLSGNVVNNALWTIRLEVLFSLALPVFVMAAVALRRFWAVTLGLSLLVVWVGAMYSNFSLEFFPVFLAGTMLAVHHEALRDWARRVGSSPRADLAWIAVLLGGGTLLILGWLVWPLISAFEPLHKLAGAAAFLGALVIVATAFLWAPMARFLTTAPLRWLGRVSFSLYLVHLPLLVFFANLYGPGHWLRIVASTVVVAFVVAELFTRFVEQPSHRLSKHVGAALVTRFRTVMTERHAPDGAPARSTR